MTLVAIRKPERPVLRGPLPNLRDLPRAELGAFLSRELGAPRFRGDQVFSWLHARRVGSFADMSDVPRGERARLDGKATLSRLEIDATLRGEDGTRKLRLRTADGALIETVLIPNEDRGLTQCVSSQIGCCLSCAFCATASLGFQRNLAAWEIVDQVYQAQDMLAREAEETGAKWPERVQNLVFMGMGEPLANYNQVTRAIALLTDPKGAAIAGRRITISSAGLVPAIERFAREGLGEEVGLAISLNATTDATRDAIMPINTRWDIATLLAAVAKVPQHRRRFVTFEYVLLADVNDSDEDALRLAKLVGGARCQINVIPFNPHPHAPYRRPSSGRVDRFVALCRERGLLVFVRTPRGDDIGAACGQLALEGAQG